MKKKEAEFLSSNRKTKIHVISWIPEETPKGILQIAHGMVEYIERYDDFARFMAENGYLVTGNDHLGHGASVTKDEDHGYFGHPDGNRHVIDDMHHLREITEGEAAQTYGAGIPYFMLGHSMGSFLLRQYITMYGEGLAGGIIMGTGYQSPATLSAGKFLCMILSVAKGWKGRSGIVNNMAIGAYNKQFEPARTPADWLTNDEEIVDKYVSDPWCSFTFTINGYYQMFTGIQAASNKKNIDNIPKDLPLLVVSGANDPVGDNGKGVEKVYDMYRGAGITDLGMKLYEGDRHEILNELDKDTVYSDILDWITERTV